MSALALLDAASAGVYAGAIVRSFSGAPPLRVRGAWLYCSFAAVFAADRFFFADSLTAGLLAALFGCASVVAVVRGRDALANVLLLPAALAMVVIATGDAYDPRTQDALRPLPATLFALPALALAPLALMLSSFPSRRTGRRAS